MMGAPNARSAFVARGAAVGGRDVRAAHSRSALLRSGSGAYEAHHAALGAGAEQSALRTAQNFDAVEVEQRRERH